MIWLSNNNFVVNISISLDAWKKEMYAMQWSKDEPLYWQHLTHQKSKITKKRYILTNNQFYIYCVE